MIAMGILTGLLAGAAPKAGALAPDFTVTDTDGNKITLSEQVKQGTVIVAFFPRAFTPG